MSTLKVKNGNTWIEIPAGGQGVPSGGTTGQFLRKSNSTDYATEWSTVTLGDVSSEDVVPISKGGTGATSASAARANLDAANSAFEPLNFNISGGKTISFSGFVSFLLVTNYTNTNRQGMWIVCSTATGTAAVTPIVAPLNVTITAGTAQITLTSGSSDCYCYILPLTDVAKGRITIS